MNHQPETSHAAGQRSATDEDLERVAAEETVHPLTVLRAYAGLPIRGNVAERARRAAAKLRELQVNT